MSDFLTCIAGSQLAATQSSVTRPLSTTVKPENMPTETLHRTVHQ